MITVVYVNVAFITSRENCLRKMYSKLRYMGTAVTNSDGMGIPEPYNSCNNGLMVDQPMNGTELDTTTAHDTFLIKVILFNMGVYTVTIPIAMDQKGSRTGGKNRIPRKHAKENRAHTAALASHMWTVPATKGRPGLLIRSTSMSCMSFRIILAAEIL